MTHVIHSYLHCKPSLSYPLKFKYRLTKYRSAQGAAQAIEDAAVLGHLFERLEDVSQIPKAIRLYEAIRKPRTSRVTAASNARREMYQLPDGEAQQARDEGLRRESRCNGYPRWFEDPAFHSWLLNYDVRSAVTKACKS